MIKKGVPGWIVEFVWSWLCGRQTVLELPGHDPALFWENGGLPQGSCLSPILFLFFAAGLLENPNAKKAASSGVELFAFVDDTYIMVRSGSFEQNCEDLKAVHDCLFEWAENNGIGFGPDKYGLLHFKDSVDSKKTITCCPAIENLPPAETLFEKDHLVILGVAVDSCLSWGPHVDHIIGKVSKQMRFLACISGSTWGPNLDKMCQFYTAQVQSIMSYACPAWFFTKESKGGRAGTIAMSLAKKLDRLQRECLVEISGAMCSTSTAVLLKELHIPKLSRYLQATTISYHAKVRGSPFEQHLRAHRATLLGSKKKREKHPFWHLDQLVDTLLEDTKDRMMHTQGKDKGIERWENTATRANAINRQAKRRLHDQSSLDWERYRDEKKDGSERALALAEEWGPESRRYYKGLTRKQCTILFHCRTGHIGLRAHLKRINIEPTDECPFCHKGKHTVEHLFLHCNGTSRIVHKRRKLRKETHHNVHLRSLFTLHPYLVAEFALDTFGIEQFTEYSWRSHCVGKRPRADEVDDHDDAEPKKKIPRLLRLRKHNFK